MIRRLLFAPGPLLVVALTAAAAGQAHGQPLVQNFRYGAVAPFTPTAISGRPGTHSVDLFNPPTARGHRSMTSIIGWERGDEPCSFQLLFWYTNDPEFDVCNGDRQSMRRLRFGAVGNREVQPVVTSIQACLNRRGDRLKGLRFEQRNYDFESGTWLDVLPRKEWERTNCRDWQGVMRCPQGHGGVGLVMEYAGRSVSGVRLVCASYQRR